MNNEFNRDAQSSRSGSDSSSQQQGAGRTGTSSDQPREKTGSDRA